MRMECDKSLNERLHSNPSTFSIPHVNNFFQITISEFFGSFNDNFHYNPNKTESGCVGFSFRTDYRYPQNASESIPEHILKKIKSGGACPQPP